SNRELASKSNIALLFPPADPPALAKAIERFAQDPELRSALGARAVSLFEACYTEGRMLNDYRRLYEDLVQSHILASGQPARAGSIIRSATPGDLPDIVAIHQKAFNHFFLTRMGAAFLRRYYELVLHYHAGIVLVAERHGVLEGFVCGFADPAAFYRSMWRNRFSFALPAVTALLRNPSLGAHMVNAVRRIQ